MQTDESGTVRVGVGRGKHELSLSVRDWKEEQAIEVSSGGAQSIEFHRSWLQKRTITGRLLWNNSPYRPSPKAAIRAEAKNGRDSAVVDIQSKIRPDGTFKIETDSGDVSVFVIDPAKQLSAFARRSGRRYDRPGTCTRGCL